MKLATVNHNVRSSNLDPNQTSEMQILQSAKMFEMLAGLYTDVPKAILRELVANADDANRSIGQTRPFQVALPSDLEPALAIKDFGPGMSHHFMMNGYCWVGHSTKAETNGQIGGFGLGRLAPIAYEGATAYTVTSIHEGVKRVYLVFRNERGVPTVSCASEEITDEPSGVEIKVPIAKADYQVFATKLQQVLRWFDATTYEVFGADIRPIQVNLRSSTYVDVRAEFQRNYCLMGPIAYEIDWSQIGQQLPLSLVPIFQIGELDLPPSREQVTYSPITLAAMRKRFEEVSQDLPPRVLAEAVNMTPRQRVELVTSLKAGGLSDLFEAYHKAEGHREEDNDAREKYRERTGGLYDFKPKWGKFLLREHETLTIKGAFTYYEKAGSRVKSSYVSARANHWSEIVFNSSDDFKKDRIFYLQDVEAKNPKMRERLMGHRAYAGQGFLIVHDKAVFDQLKALIPEGKFELLSDHEPPYKPSTRSRLWHKVYRVGNNYGTDDDGELPEEGIYVPYEGKELADRPGVHSWSTLTGVAWATQAIYYGLNKGAQRKVDLTRFELLDAYLKRKLRQALADPAVIRALSAAETLDQARKLTLFDFTSSTDYLPKVKALIEATRADARAVASVDIDSVRRLAQLGFATLPKTRDFHRLIPALERAEKRNPVLMAILNPPHDYRDEALFRKIVK